MTNLIALANSIEIIQINVFRSQTVLKYYTESKIYIGWRKQNINSDLFLIGQVNSDLFLIG